MSGFEPVIPGVGSFRAALEEAQRNQIPERIPLPPQGRTRSAEHWVSYVRDQKLHASRKKKKKKPGSKIVIYSKKIKQGSSVSFLNY